ncbi:MAG: sugar transferase [Flavobacteriales bacterium]|nr:sugar transferase [Flavobacteriales bacterium]
MYQNFLKPILDFLVALTLFVVLLPLFVLTLITLSITLKGNPFFTQRRPGKHERIFKIIKFKTMTNERDENGQLLPDAKRLTNFGKFIRSASLDEIPQLLNVIKGDMSIVGPRPLLPEYLPLYTEFQKQRHLVKPGITGYAQVNGRNAISWEKKFELDVYYVKNCNFATDLTILFQTVKKVVSRSDINTSGSATTERFKGSSNT